MNKKVGVLFSSGLDSTYLVWKNLMDGNTVQPLYIEIENNVIKSKIEKNRVELLYTEFHKEFGNLIYPIDYPTKVNVLSCGDKLYFHQIPIWIFSILFCQCLDIEEIQIGYVSNDDAISYLDDIQNIYKSYQSISENQLPLVFPLTKKKKYMMANELPKQYFDLIFSCENANIIGSEDATIIQYEPCCECVPCRHIIADNYYEIGRFPENYEKNLIKQNVYKLWKSGYRVIDKKGNDYGDQFAIKSEPYQLMINFNENI